MQRQDVDLGEVRERCSAAADLADARQEHQDIAAILVAEGIADRSGDLLGEGRLAGAGLMAHHHRMRPAGGGYDLGVREEARHRLGIHGR